MGKIRMQDVALMGLPSLLLAGLGLALSRRPVTHPIGQQISTPVVSNGPFRLIVNRVYFHRDHHSIRSWGFSGSPRKQARFCTKDEEVLNAEIFVDYTGKAPSWWTNAIFDRSKMNVTGVFITDANHTTRKIPYFYNGNFHCVRRYALGGDCYVRKGSSLKGCTFTATAFIPGAGSVTFSAPLDDTEVGSLDMADGLVTPGIHVLKSTSFLR